MGNTYSAGPDRPRLVSEINSVCWTHLNRFYMSFHMKTETDLVSETYLIKIIKTMDREKGR
jgi:hypothetical protein